MRKIVKILNYLIMFGILISMMPYMVAAERPSPDEEPDGLSFIIPEGNLAIDYCQSDGGSHDYEYISSVTCTNNPGNTMTITVDIFIANPEGCTYGEECPDYDESPEYINAWIDWNGDKIWDSSERVMDEALTGYTYINYKGTMTVSKIITIPDNAVGLTWMRTNLGWDSDPNDPCEEYWEWGDVVDKEILIKYEEEYLKVVGGLSQYEGKYKDIVFRRGEQNPLFEITALVSDDEKVKVDIIDNGDIIASLNALRDENKGSYIAIWDWKSNKWNNIPDEIPVGEYKAKAIITTKDGIELLTSDEIEFYVIFDTPTGLNDAEKRAYLYSDNKYDRYIKGNEYGRRNWEAAEFYESEYYLEPVDECVFGISIHVIDSITKETTASERLCTMVHNTIHYSSPNTLRDVPRMLSVVSLEDAIVASNDQGTNLIEGQCLDYANTLTSVLRSTGIAARPATGIWYIPLHPWAYHVWTETYVPEAPGDDPWYIYDGTLDNQSQRNSFSWGEDASEVAVGNSVWMIDGGILQRTVPGDNITRYNIQANDILLEKCENNNYDNSGCLTSTSLGKISNELSNCSINLTLDKYSTRVGEPIAANITLSNLEDEQTNLELNISIYTFNPSSNIIGYDKLIDNQTQNITIPSSGSVTLEHTFFINTTNYPNKWYILEIIGEGENNYCNVNTSIEVLPAYTVNITLPDDLSIEEPVPINITICNNVDFILENIIMEIDIPDEYNTSDELIKTISLLNPGACEEFNLVITPIEDDFFSIISLYFTVNSNNGGNYSAILYKELIEGPKLDIEDDYILFDGEFGEPFEIGFKISNNGDQIATNVSVKIVLPENVTATETAWEIGDLAGGENVSLYTNITFTESEDFIIGISASDDAGHNTSGVILMHMPIFTNLSANFNNQYTDYGSDTNGDGMYEYLTVEIGVNATNEGISKIEGCLCDSNGTKIANSTNSTFLSAGDNFVILKFDGFDIYKHNMNGSYDIEDIKLFNESGNILDNRSHAYTTSEYNYTDFQHLISLTGHYFDYGIDTNDNGLYDNLSVDIGVILANEGNCIATARLVDTNGEEIVWASNTSWLLANQPQIIVLSFSGLSINEHGIDGPYYLRDVYVYHTGDPVQSDYIFNASITSHYNYTDFERGI